MATRYDVRDQLGHWVTPRRMERHPCPHHCCQGKQVHPDNLPVKLSRTYLRSLSEPELERELSQYGRYSDQREAGFLQIIAEFNRREDSARLATARRERARDRRQRQESDYRDEVYRQWLKAEAATNGYMLNKEGLRRNIDERSLFTGPEARVRKYASPELKEWFDNHPRMTRELWFAQNNPTERRRILSGRRLL